MWRDEIIPCYEINHNSVPVLFTDNVQGLSQFCKEESVEAMENSALRLALLGGAALQLAALGAVAAVLAALTARRGLMRRKQE